MGNEIKEYNIQNLGEEKFFKFFKEISDIPRKSSNEGKIADYLVKFAKYRGYKYYRDELNNVVIYKPASKGYENKSVLGLQNHTDMICEKDPNVKHDFSKDKLELYIDGDFVKAKGTTLGADNGVGVAYVLAILDSKDIKTPELECIFTVQEETTMDGARNFDVSKIKSKRIISFDSFYDDIMVINSSSCKEWSSRKIIDKEQLDKNKEYLGYTISFSNFKGGHSGLDIADKKRGNPIKETFKLLRYLDTVKISYLNGGSRVSIIPRDMQISFCIESQEVSKIKKIEKEILDLQNYFNEGEKIEIKSNTLNKEWYIANKTSLEIINFVNEFENGALVFDEENQVILSCNMGVVEIVDNSVVFRYSSRSNEKKLGLDKYKELNNLIKKYDIEILEYDEMKAFEPIPNSELIDSVSSVYYKTYNKEITKIKSQTCLEIGFWAEKIKNLEYVAIAPNIYNAHSPKEKFSISSSKKFWKFIINILKEI